MKVYTLKGTRFADGEYHVASQDSLEMDTLRDSLALEIEELEEGKNHSFTMTIAEGSNVQTLQYHVVCGDVIVDRV